MPQGPKVFPPDEPLYRVLKPGQWKTDGNLVEPVAYRDPWPQLSVYLGSKASPRRVLEIFARIEAVRKKHNDPTPEGLWDLGYGIARFAYKDAMALGLDFERTSGGAAKFKANGHVNIPDGQKHAADLAIVAVALRYDEIFG